MPGHEEKTNLARVVWKKVVHVWIEPDAADLLGRVRNREASDLLRAIRRGLAQSPRVEFHGVC